MPAAIPIAMGVSAATGLVGAKMQSSAAKNAAKTQAGSADKALALQERIYNQNRQDQMPWLNAGGSAVSQLARLTGVGGGGLSQNQGQGYPYAMNMSGGPQRSPLASLANAGQMVTLKAPNGMTKQFSADDPALQHYLGLQGVERVG